MADKEEKVAQFSAVAGVDAERATFFLESAAWNLEVTPNGVLWWVIGASYEVNS